MKKGVLFLGIFLFVLQNVNSEAYYPASDIPQELLTDAYAVVRESSESFIQQDENNGTYKIRYVITVLNENGKSHSSLLIHEDFAEELKSFSGEIYDEKGKLIKKIGKKDLSTTAYSSDLATTAKQTWYNCYAPAYPYTVKYEYEIKYKKGILFYPSFLPTNYYHTALEKAEYSLQVPDGFVIRYKSQATDIQPEKTTIGTNTVYKWTLTNFPAVSQEKYAPVTELFPVVYLSPEKFCVEGFCGNMATWENYGKWSTELLKGRNQLPPKIIEKALELTQGVSDAREKVWILYNYLQQTTHYVGIQLGIGGWQPMKAEEVAQTGFGDCKALSNYMRSLLQVVEIPSYYLIINSTEERFFSDFPSFGQANHVIVMVPLEKDTFFLECTSQVNPFGYFHYLSGHDALAVNENQSFFYTLPVYDPKENLEENRIQIQVDANGNAQMEVHSTLKNKAFEDVYFSLKRANSKEENDLLASLLQVPKPKISNIQKEEILNEHPQLTLKFSVNTEDFATKTNSRLLIPVNPARTSLRNLLTGSSRKYDIVMKSTLHQKDTIHIRIPEGYEIETKPKPVEIESEYGYFSSELEEQAEEIIYIQTVEIKPGRYSASAFDEMKKFYNRIETLQNTKIGLKAK